MSSVSPCFSFFPFSSLIFSSSNFSRVGINDRVKCMGGHLIRLATRLGYFLHRDILGAVFHFCRCDVYQTFQNGFGRVERFLYLFPVAMVVTDFIFVLVKERQSSLNFEFNIIFQSLIFNLLVFSVIFNKKYFILF